jgi:hypothetical protein
VIAFPEDLIQVPRDFEMENMSSSEGKRHPRWWLVYTHPLHFWETDDLEAARELIAKRPPNKAIEHPSIVGFLAGYFQAVGELGYLEISASEDKMHVPFIQVSGEREVIDKIVRLMGDVQEIREKDEALEAIFTGLRAIIFLRIISPFLLGKVRIIADEIVNNGYKISDAGRARDLLNRLGIKKIEVVQEEPVRILKKFCAR